MIPKHVPDPIAVPTSEDLAYLAGYFDGEGTVTWGVGRNTACLRIAINSGDLEILQLFGRFFGGQVYPRKRNPRLERRDKRAMFMWTRNGTAAQGILRQLLPYLHSKRPVANLALLATFRDKKGYARMSVEERDLRFSLVAQTKAYNNRVTVDSVN